MMGGNLEVESYMTRCMADFASVPLSVKLTASLLFAFAVYYKSRVSKAPKMVCKEGKFKSFIKQAVPASQQNFSPFFMMFGSVPQTVGGALLRPTPRIDWNDTEDIDLPDKGQVHLHWLHAANSSTFSDSTRPIVLFLPGLTGNNDSNYICRFSQHLEKEGYRAVVFTYRGMGGKGLKTPKTYCACYTDDLRHVILHIKQKYPNAPLMAVGVSLGAMILFHYLAQTGKDGGLLAAMTISLPWNPFESMKTLSTPLNKMLYNKRFAKALVSLAERHAHLFKGVVNLDHVRQSNTIHEFDETFTAQVFGFESLDHYYSSAMAADKVEMIKVPLLALNAADDAFSPGYCIPLGDIEKSDHLALLLTERGGHVGFIDTMFGRGTTFMDRVFMQYVSAVFDNLDQISSM